LLRDFNTLHDSVTDAGASWLVRKHRGWWALPLEGVGVHAAGAVSGWSK